MYMCDIRLVMMAAMIWLYCCYKGMRLPSMLIGMACVAFICCFCCFLFCSCFS